MTLAIQIAAVVGVALASDRLVPFAYPVSLSIFKHANEKLLVFFYLFSSSMIFVGFPWAFVAVAIEIFLYPVALSNTFSPLSYVLFSSDLPHSADTVSHSTTKLSSVFFFSWDNLKSFSIFLHLFHPANVEVPQTIPHNTVALIVHKNILLAPMQLLLRYQN